MGHSRLCKINSVFLFLFLLWLSPFDVFVNIVHIWNNLYMECLIFSFYCYLNHSKQSVRCMRFTSSGKYTTANVSVFVDACRFIWQVICVYAPPVVTPVRYLHVTEKVEALHVKHVSKAMTWNCLFLFTPKKSDGQCWIGRLPSPNLHNKQPNSPLASKFCKSLCFFGLLSNHPYSF